MATTERNNTYIVTFLPAVASPILGSSDPRCPSLSRDSLRHDEHVAGLSVDSSGAFNSIVSETALILLGIFIKSCL